MSNSRFFATHDVIVSFGDVDSMGVVWHGNYFRYFEQAREKLFRQLNFNYSQMMKSGYCWPIVDTKVKYIAPVFVEQAITISAELDEEFENRFKINYIVTDTLSGKQLTKAYTVQVAVDITTREMSFVTPQYALDKLRK